MKKMLLFIFVLAFGLMLVACSSNQNLSALPEPQTYSGYLFLEGNTLKIDDFEFITSKDTERIKELKLTEEDMPNGYYIHNESEDIKSFTLDEKTQYHFYDTGNLFVKEEDDKRYSTTDLEQFELFLYGDDDIPLHTPFEIEVQGENVISINEIFVN